MRIYEKYKTYAHLFFAYIIVYHLFLFYTIFFADLVPITKEALKPNYFAFLIYVFFIILNKSILYYAQISEEHFNFWASGYPWNSVSRTITELLGFVKSLAGIFFYVIFNLIIFERIYILPKEVDPTPFYMVVQISFYVFIAILITWDIARLSYLSIEKRDAIKRNREAHLKYARNMEMDASRKDRPEELGFMTGYEPKKLANIKLLSTPLMKGNPGAGLSGSSFSQSNVQAGALGELNFAKVLQKHDYLEKFATYWSVQYPFESIPGPDSTLNADIDCILISKNNVYLLDLKLYTQGNITWKMINNGRNLQAVDNVTGDYVGKSRKTSKNMYFATKRISAKLKGLGVDMKVKPYVIMMPTDRGLGKVEDVIWPGDVECLTIIDFLAKIENQKPYNASTSDAEVVDSVFTWLLKDESGSAPRYQG